MTESPEPPLSPVKWRRRRSWRSLISSHREVVVPSSIPVSARVLELEKRKDEKSSGDLSGLREMLQRLIDLHSTPHYAKGDNDAANANEELQTTMSELQEARLSLLLFERRYAAIQRKGERLEAELNMTKKELELAREQLMRRRSAHGSKTSRLNRSLDGCNAHCTANTSDSSDQSIVKELEGKIAWLHKEVEKRDALIASERSSHIAELKDFIVAVKVAERHRDETLAEVQRLLEVKRILASPDELLWMNLMQKYQSVSKRNALLAWAQAHLTAYPSISVSNFTSDWRDGRAFCALIHHFQPEMVDRILLVDGEVCSQLAMELAAKLHIPIDPMTFSEATLDFKKVIAVVFELYKKLDAIEEHC